MGRVLEINLITMPNRKIALDVKNCTHCDTHHFDSLLRLEAKIRIEGKDYDYFVKCPTTGNIILIRINGDKAGAALITAPIDVPHIESDAEQKKEKQK